MNHRSPDLLPFRVAMVTVIMVLMVVISLIMATWIASDNEEVERVHTEEV